MRFAALFLSGLFLTACGGADSGGDSPATCSVPPSQGLSSPCCLEHGLDACGANLFCAALDGRAVATCYPERSRLSGESCTEDRQCVHGSCNLEVGACRSGNREACTPEIGCVASVTTAGLDYGCFDGRCDPVGHGFVGDLCLEDVHCGSRSCVDQRCAPMTCGVGTGQRTCSEDWADDRCTSCILTQTYDCPADLSACESLDVSVANCVAACDGDARCMNRECAEVMCHLAQCLDKRCPDVGERCF